MTLAPIAMPVTRKLAPGSHPNPPPGMPGPTVQEVLTKDALPPLGLMPERKFGGDMRCGIRFYPGRDITVRPGETAPAKLATQARKFLPRPA